MGLNERKKVGLVIAAAVGIAAIAVLVLYLFTPQMYVGGP